MCSKCGQIDIGQTGEYPCSECGLPILWDEVKTMWQNHNPFPPSKQSETLPIIPARIIKLAKNAGGEFIHPDGESIYMWRYDKMYVAWWNGTRFGAWEIWTKEDIPTGILKEL